MCGQFLLIPQEIVDEIIKEVEAGSSINLMPDWPATEQSAYPKTEVPVIVPEGEHLVSAIMKWGYEVSWNKNVIFNTRSDTVLQPKNTMWTESFRNRRCIVPTFGFFESHQSETYIDVRTGKERKQQYLFKAPNTPVLFVAGIYEQRHFSLMTTEPNAVMESIHIRMPVVLAQDELDIWLRGDYESLLDRSATRLVANKVQPS